VEEQAVTWTLIHHEPLDAAPNICACGGEVGVLLVVCEHYDAAGVLEAKPVLQAILDALQREREE
jgi:hypothetical protein